MAEDVIIVKDWHIGSDAGVWRRVKKWQAVVGKVLGV
jgi:hypothetical protein